MKLDFEDHDDHDDTEDWDEPLLADPYSSPVLDWLRAAAWFTVILIALGSIAATVAKLGGPLQ